jgi:magnesium-transporting ATPase (P-type)
MNLLMTIAVLGAAGIGEWSEGAAVAFLFALSELLESFSVARARRAIQSLLKLAPQSALLKNGDRFDEVPVEKVHVGDIIAVKSGARVPLDGAIVNGNSSVDQAPITGESMPVEKKQGDQVFAGTINGEGSLEVRVTKNYSDTTLLKDHSPRRGSPIAESTLTTARGCVCEVLHAIGDGVCVARFPPPINNFRCSVGCLVLPRPGDVGYRLPVCVGNLDSGIDCFGPDGDGPPRRAHQRRCIS